MTYLPTYCAIKTVIDVGQRHAYNAASILTPQGRLIVFRGGDGESLWYGWLDDAWELRAGPYKFDVWHNDDPRLLWHEGHLCLSTCYWWDGWRRCRSELRTLNIHRERLDISAEAKFHRVQGLPPQLHEKNWIPFSHAGKLMYVYSIHPHRILEVNGIGGRLSAQTSPTTLPWQIPGDLRGSTNPVLIGDEYLSTFHVRDGKDYFHGFYRYRARPPFEITAMSAEPFAGPDDSAGVCWRNNNLRLLFLQSMEVAGGTLTLVGGDNDQAAIRLDMPLSEVLAKLQPVAMTNSTAVDALPMPA